jgi:hypothetical protein
MGHARKRSSPVSIAGKRTSPVEMLRSAGTEARGTRLVGTQPQLAGQLKTASSLTHTVLSNEADASRLGSTRKEMNMLSLTEISRAAQQYICMGLSALIVTASLSLGALMAEAAAQPDYSVTITQIL